MMPTTTSCSHYYHHLAREKKADEIATLFHQDSLGDTRFQETRRDWRQRLWRRSWMMLCFKKSLDRLSGESEKESKIPRESWLGLTYLPTYVS